MQGSELFLVYCLKVIPTRYKRYLPTLMCMAFFYVSSKVLKYSLCLKYEPKGKIPTTIRNNTNIMYTNYKF